MKLPKHADALTYVKKYNISLEKTYDSLIYTMHDEIAANQTMHGMFIKQPKLQKHDQDAGTSYKILETNKKYVMANILEN